MAFLLQQLDWNEFFTTTMMTVSPLKYGSIQIISSKEAVKAAGGWTDGGEKKKRWKQVQQFHQVFIKEGWVVVSRGMGADMITRPRLWQLSSGASVASLWGTVKTAHSEDKPCKPEAIWHILWQQLQRLKCVCWAKKDLQERFYRAASHWLCLCCTAEIVTMLEGRHVCQLPGLVWFKHAMPHHLVSTKTLTKLTSLQSVCL